MTSLLQKGQRKVYEDPAEFFALTFPTLNLRELARDVAMRLAGEQRQGLSFKLSVTYGGGKTHTLITLCVTWSRTLPRCRNLQAVA